MLVNKSCSAGRRKLSLASKQTDLESELEFNQGKGKRVRKATKRYSPNTSKDDGESSDNEYGEAPNLLGMFPKPPHTIGSPNF
ncbi:hypothetical protein OUZ56_025993 [Daphnia magna]|uniref:Uncharacterized protein n=1 Tax=Daphnia magna TaxID=35525 RepID=A0ABQ9ZKI4_9CRUS|nr:hypothetical protein OUZ56_025993 [Daphnia magna]